jgi:phosphatidylglycerophosphate synthase
LLWGLTADERLRRIAKEQGLSLGEDGPVLVNLGYVFDPTWLRFIAGKADHVVTFGGTPVLANVAGDRSRIVNAMERGEALGATQLTVVAWEESGGLTNDELRKRERPFMDRLAPETVCGLERASYFGAYKGVTDILTKYLWPEWALVLTRWAARMGVTPNQVTALGAILCAAAAVAFYYGWYWTGLVAGLAFMVLDTVDGKLARCTITSSWWGNVFDHGIDLVHPPFWWYAWGVGLVHYGQALADAVFWVVLAVIVFGYVAQRLIEGAFIALFKMHIHVWRPFDSRFRLITARRNPNMIILLASLIVGRPDLGLIAVALWTLISLLVHLIRLFQALIARAGRRPIISWLA